MKHLFLSFLLLIAFNANADEREWSFNAGVGYDPRGYTALTINGDWFPTARDLSWGVRTFVQGGHYDYDGETGAAAVAGVLPVVTWKGLYGGIGGAINTITPQLGTPYQFATQLGYQISLTDDWKVDLNFTHFSHCSKCGIAEDKDNGGVTTGNVFVEWRF